ncbi:MAG: hypothetical protein KAT17_05790 [Candidatus Aminicenantes bacterium]|nr:hypothetical protein [Candidatus Aminicenantes bacterium]
MKIIGIRRENKNEWEKRAPLIPRHVKELKEKFGIHTILQPSTIRVFSDDQYRRAGAEINEDLGQATVVFAIKEIPAGLLEPDKTYVFFSHTIKGQPHNMKMLQRLKDLKTNLIDYERIMDANNRRLIFFGEYAGLAGMIETLHCFGQKLKLQGFETPLDQIKQAYQYHSLEEAKDTISKIGREISQQGFPPDLSPMVIGFAGYGNVSRGAQKIFDLLPHKVIAPHILTEMAENFASDNHHLYKVVFKEEDLVRSRSGRFDLQDYYDFPEKYESRFEDYLPYLQVLVNCIYWTDDYPRLVTKKYLKDNTILSSNLNLRVVGDISCDIEGSIEITHKANKPDNPCFTYFAREDNFEDGVKRQGVSVMAIDNLPCEFPRESSEYFSSVFKQFVNEIAEADFQTDFAQLSLSSTLKNALILLNGKFTADYDYLNDFLTGG